MAPRSNSGLIRVAWRRNACTHMRWRRSRPPGDSDRRDRPEAFGADTEISPYSSPRCSDHDPAAGHIQGDARNPGAMLRGQAEDGGGDVLRLPEAPQGQTAATCPRTSSGTWCSGLRATSTAPGGTPLIRTPRGPISRARWRVPPRRPYWFFFWFAICSAIDLFIKGTAAVSVSCTLRLLFHMSPNLPSFCRTLMAAWP